MEPTRADGDRAARRRALGHRDPELADDHRARPRRRRVPRARARPRRDRVRARDVRDARPTSPRSTRRRSSRATPRSTPSATGQSLVIAQIETVGDAVLDRRDELLDELATLREARGHVLYALMVTDIMAKGTKMLVAGEHAPARARLRPAGGRRRDRPAGRHEPQEAGRAEAARRAVRPALSRRAARAATASGSARSAGGPCRPRRRVGLGRHRVAVLRRRRSTG